jgi:hypothetical protein
MSLSVSVNNNNIGMVSNQFIPARMVKDGGAALQVVNSQDPGPAAAAEAGGGVFHEQKVPLVVFSHMLGDDERRLQKGAVQEL